MIHRRFNKLDNNDMTEQNSKKIENSQVTLSLLMGPQNANRLGNVHGGVIMKIVDEAGAIAAMKHAQAPVVTVAVDSMTFVEPIHIGEVVTFNAELTYVGRTSMEARVEVITENPLTAVRRKSNTAYLVYVALDENGRPKPVAPLLLETDEQMARATAAKERQDFRKKQRAKEV